MTQIRLGAVKYLNARPLVHGLDRQSDLFSLRFDVPSKCSGLLHSGDVDFGLITSIEYLAKPNYSIVPGVSIASNGPVGSVALFTDRPVAAIRSIAIDNSSKTSVALLRLLCAEWFEIEPKFVTVPPDLPKMLQRCDAAMLIGDVALWTDPDVSGLNKVDLGEEWTAMTGKPFVWAVWAGRLDVELGGVIGALQGARDAGVIASDEIAREYSGGDEDRIEIGQAYLSENITYGLGEEELSGLRKFLNMASDLRIIQTDVKLTDVKLRFYET